MNSFDTLFFPETDIFNEKHYPLLLFFTPLHFLQVMEADPDSAVNPEAVLCLERGFCKPHIPAPLYDKRAQFLRLIREIREQNQNVGGRLREIITAPTPDQAGEKAPDSRRRIVSSLLQEYGVQLASAGKDLQLWQARLILVIGEILDSKEETLREQLFIFSEDEIATFRSLQERDDEKGDDIFSELDNIQAELEKSRLGNIIKRFEAWLRLMQNRAIPPVKVWLASTRGSADQILNRYTSTSHTQAVPLLKLALPAHMTARGHYLLEEIEKFQQATVSIHRGLVDDFERIMTTVPYVRDMQESLLPYGTDWAEQWEDALDEFFPASTEGRVDITFYLLPDQPVTRLLSLHELPGISHDRVVHGLLAFTG